MKGGESRFLREHKTEFGPIVTSEVAIALQEDTHLTSAQITESIERVETKILVWERPQAAADAKRVLLEASEPAAYRTIKPLIAFLQHDERCRAITLVTDNTAGKNFMDEQESSGFKQVRDPNQPVFADIAGPFDSVLVLSEPKNSPNKPFLYGGKSVYGDDRTKIFFMLDGVLGHTTHEQFTAQTAEHMDFIDTIGVANEFSKQLLAAAVPRLRGRIRVVGSILLQSFKDDLIKNKLFETHDVEEERRSLRETLKVPQDAVMVLYSGFPSIDYVALGGKADADPAQGEKTLNQETFERTLEAVKIAALENPDKTFALAIRTHSRAAGIDNELRVPDVLPGNLHIIWASGLPLTYDDVANAADVIACQSTSTEVLYAPYRGVVAAVSGYAGKGMQDELNKKIFGSGLTTFKKSDDLLYVDSVETFAMYLKNFHDRPSRRPIPDNPIPRIADMLLGTS
ncbi:hypothetical protein HY412_00840 [Candidatus Kaiserbacteria bacterium]|nr:hypothetical protein [Candidatus Kaiserbacteria bacterium]